MKMRFICLAGGCFWGTEAYLQRLPGVLDTEVGYANSLVESPSYEYVCSGRTHAAEAVLVTYDPSVIPLQTLLEAFARTIDPTSLNKQGNDRGTQYRTGIYWLDAADEEPVRNFLEHLQTQYAAPIVVEAQPLEAFAEAEGYHQDYLQKNPSGYCHVNLSDADIFVKQHWGDTGAEGTRA